MWLFNGFCAPLQGERCVRGTKWIGMSKTKLPLSNISSASFASALFTFFVIYPASIFLAHSPEPPRLEGCGRDELADQKKIFKATVWEPCSFQLIWAGLLFSCIPPALMLTGLWAIGDYIMESTHNAFWVLCQGTNDGRIRCVWSPGSISRWLWWLKRGCDGHIYVWIHTMVAPLSESCWFSSSLFSNKSFTWTKNNFIAS